MQTSVSNDELMVKLCAIEGAIKQLWLFLVKNDITMLQKDEKIATINKYFADLDRWCESETQRIIK